jgi:hypothetical protein
MRHSDSGTLNKKITYLLGAGASCEAVPVSKNLTKTMLQWVAAATGMPAIVHQHPQFVTFTKNIAELCSASDNVGGIDAYARVLFLSKDSKNEMKLRTLKATLSCWLLALQRGGKIDRRYVHFMGVLARPSNDRIITFDQRANIITWNYDLQVELTLALRFGIPQDRIISILNAPLPNHEEKIDEDHFFLLRLNGFAGAHSEAGKFKQILDLLLTKDSKQSMLEILDLYGRYLARDDLIPAINFAWETNSMWSQYIRDNVTALLSKTTHLVIIGYSFPSFNTEIDRPILTAMKPANVTIQDINANDMTQKVKQLVPEWPWEKISLRQVTNCDQLEAITA